MNSYDKGTHTLSTIFKVGTTNTDPSTVTFTLTGGNDSVSYVYGTDTEIVKDDTGKYHVDYEFTESGYYKYSFVGTGACEAIDSDYIVIGSTADLITSTSIELEDISNTIFSSTTVNQGIEKALSIVSRYIPYESKVTVDLTEDSRDVDVSNIKGLLKVIKAEYEIGQNPKEFRNVTKFGNTITIGVEDLPEDGDQAYLYCHLVHTADTIDIPLMSIVPRLAAAYCAMNWVGEGRTQIVAAKDAISTVNTTIGNMSARLTQAINDTTSMRTQITNLLSGVSSVITDANSALDNAMVEFNSSDSAIDDIDITTPLSSADVAVGLAITDIDKARTLLATNSTILASELAKIDDEIGLAKTDLASARALNNYITEDEDAEAQLHASANVQLNEAQTLLSELNGIVGSGSQVAPNSSLSSSQLNAASEYLSKARLIISEYANKSSALTTIGYREVSAANGYLSEARTIISEFINALNGYVNALSSEIKIANGYLNQSSGYIRSINTRISVAQIISSYQKWGQTQYQIIMSELRVMSKPTVFQTYSES